MAHGELGKVERSRRRRRRESRFGAGKIRGGFESPWLGVMKRGG